MKPTCRYIAAVLLSASTFLVNAKEGNTSYNSPAQFMQNKGQITDQHGAVRRDIDVKIEANGVVLFVGDGEMHYQFYKSQNSNPDSYRDKSQKRPVAEIENPKSKIQDQKSDIEIYRMDVKLVGANKNAEVIFEEPTGYYEHYYLAHTGEDGVTAKGYGRVIYKDIYPNIDLVLYTAGVSGASIPPPSAKLTPPPAGDNIKYDFIVHPGGNPAVIQLRYEGATELKLTDGSIVAITPYGTITEAAPYSYSKETGEEVASAYKLSGNMLSFDIGSYTGTLVIDPTLHWATYYGGSGFEGDPKIRTDNNGNLYLAGITNSNSNIATTGAYMDTLTTSTYAHVFLVKFDSAGTRIWGTYYGGVGGITIGDLYVDPYNNIYFGGDTKAGNGIATTGAYKATLTPLYQGVQHWDGYFVKFNSAGQRVWGTYYGGNDNDYIKGITGDSSYIYVAGLTLSDTGIASANSHQPSFISGTGYSGSDRNDGFVAQFNHNGQRIWASYYGGAGEDYILDVATGNNGTLFITGQTTSDTGIASMNGYDLTNGTTLPLSYKYDVFLAKFNSSGMREWGTFYGGSDVESLPKITVDNWNNVYLSAVTESFDSISSPGSKYPVPSGISNVDELFLVKFNTNGSRVWGQYVTVVKGYVGNENYLDITTNHNGHVFIGGAALYDSTRLDPCFNQFIPSYSSLHCMFFASFDSSGSLYLSKVFSGNNYSYGGSIATYKENDVYVAGFTQATAGIATTGAHQTMFGGNKDLCLYKFSIDTNVFLEQPFKDTLFCKGQSVPMKYIVTKQFKPGNVFSVQLSDTFGSFVNPITIGTVAATGTGTINCTIPNNILQSGNYKIRIVSTNPVITPCVQTKKIGIGIAFPDSLTSSSNAPVCRYDTLRLYSSSVTPGVSYAWTGPMNYSSSSDSNVIPVIDTYGTFQYILKAGVYGCYDYDTVQVVIKPLPFPPSAGSNSPVCANDTLKLSATSVTGGVNYSWAGPNSFTSSQQNPVIIHPTAAAAGTYIVKAILNGCSRSDTVTSVQVKDIPANVSAGSNSPLCSGDTLELNSGSTTTGATYSWTGPGSFTSGDDDTIIANTIVAHNGDYYITISSNGCMVKDTVSVIVTQTPENVTAGNNGGLCTGDTLLLTSSSTTSGVSYAWTGPNNYNTQNVTRPNVQLSDAGTYTVTVTLGSCSDTAVTSVVVSQSASVNIAPLTPISICTGDTAQFAAFPNNAGINPQYQWVKNGVDITGATNSTLKTSNLNNGDAIAAKVMAATGCPEPVISNAITMTVQPILSPAVTMTADKMPPWNGGLTVTFTATPTHGGTAPEYQWKRNGQDITGATGATWGVVVNALNDNEDICVVLKSSYECAVPDTAMSNCITTAFTGVVDVVNNKNFKIYPNPVKDNVTITSTERIEKVEIFNLLGQKLLTGYSDSVSVQIDMSGLVSGVYIIKVNDSYISRLVKK